MTNAVKRFVKDYFDSSTSHHQVANAVSLVTNYISTNVLIFVSCHEEVLVVCKIFLQQISPQWFIYVVIFISSPGLCPWRAYVVNQSLASASALAKCLSFQRCA